MKVERSAYARSLTTRPMSGMLTGPVTMQRSFVRDDRARTQTCHQIALPLRDEVIDLESAGIHVIQIDEPRIHDGLPLRKAQREAYYLAVECFRLSAPGVADETQIHTHMCYTASNDILGSIVATDADVISIETTRSKMELLEAFTTYRYPNEMGLSVFDIHAPHLPTVQEMTELLVKASKGLTVEPIWIYPDCGLETRKWHEVRPAS